MEISFYHGDVLNVCPVSFPHCFPASKMKKDMNLNIIDEVSSEVKPHYLEGHGLVASTSMGLMNLASLDLERFIMQPNGMATASPTGSHCLYPKMLNVEQEFTDGFVLSLEDLHKQNQRQNIMNRSCVSTGVLPGEASVYVSLNSYVNEAVGTTINYNSDHDSYLPLPTNMEQPYAYPTHRLQVVKDEPQIVPELTSFGDSPPLSPINLDNQERIKAERKKLRNRIAASKCRKRKLERISRLEDKVKNLKIKNTDLASTASVLRKQVAQLKEKVMNHVNSGCQLLPYHVQAY
ncbi:transcription factor jun-D-like [Bufo bufo]|uniref:transcription factor jun-D-like n=1 Tax=Bufo bufo TaxID=8384 RepID=UPI001ABEC0AA|nr:transcription factor jun-D-like [Bufo bufo]